MHGPPSNSAPRLTRLTCPPLSRAIGKFFGIPHETVRRFCGADTTTALVPVEIVDEPARAGLTLVSPEGYRIEGLGVGDAAEILRRLR